MIENQGKQLQVLDWERLKRSGGKASLIPWSSCKAPF
ncbi:hypothetical protein R6258_13700 [Halomonas sp. HP20-15]|nr:hypothetical protein [Halomonas sp. HP20-15]MDW5377976.1 hypothetical protein [Halomonas sp. HP20-15]